MSGSRYCVVRRVPCSAAMPPGGAINLVTKMPSPDGYDGFVDVEAGAFNHTRFKGAVNFPLGAGLAARVAAFKLERDGYSRNLAYGQTDSAGNTLPGIDEDVDGRDLWAVRATLSWDLTDRASAWLQYNRVYEDDDRARITNQVCARNPLPTTGCLANVFGRDTRIWVPPRQGSSRAPPACCLRGRWLRYDLVRLSSPGDGQLQGDAHRLRAPVPTKGRGMGVRHQLRFREPARQPDRRAPKQRIPRPGRTTSWMSGRR